MYKGGLALFLSLSFLLIPLQAAAGEVRPDVAIFNPTAHLAHEISDLRPDPDLDFGRLENGLRYILMPNSKPEERVSMHLLVQAGSMHESSDERGIAHFLEHMLFNGTEHFGPGELVKYFQSIGMRFGPDVNARTGFYSTAYHIDLPRGDRQSLSEGLLVLRDYAAGALLPKEEVEKERSVILAEKRTRDSVDYRTFVESLRFELPDALLSRRLPIGTEQVIKATDRELLKSFYDAWYRPQRMIIVMVGDYDAAEAEELISSRFSNIKPRGPERGYPEAGRIDHKGVKPFYHHEPEAGGTAVSIEAVTKRPQMVDSRELRKKRLMAEMANEIIDNRLEKLRDEPDAPFTTAFIHSGNYLHYVELAEIRAECPPEKWEETLAVIEQSLRKALRFGFTEQEVEQVKKERLAALRRWVSSSSTRESPHLARQIISSLEDLQVFLSPAQEEELLAPMISSATADKLHSALKTAWAREHRLVLVTGDAELAKSETSPSRQILSAFERSGKKPVEPPAVQADIRFPYLSPPEGSGGIAKRETIEDLGIHRVVFDGGVVLNVKKTDFEANEISAALVFGHGNAAEPAENPGLSALAEEVVNLSGLGGLTREELKRALAGKNTYVEFSVEENCFVVEGTSVSGEEPLLFALLYARVADPGFRKDSYALAMRRFRQQYETWRHTVHGKLLLEGRRFLAGGDSRFGLPDRERFEENSLSDVRKWLAPVMAKAPIEISVVGDLDVEAVIKEAGTWFAGQQRAGTSPSRMEEGRQPFFPSGESRIFTVATKIGKGLANVAYPTDDYWDIQRNRGLSVLADVMDDRMRIQIREQMGAAYSYYAYNDPSLAYPGYGVFHAVVEIAPGAREKVMEKVEEIAKNLAENGVTEDERNRAVRPVLTSVRERVKTNSYWLESVMKDSFRHPEQFAWSRSFLTGYEAITSEDLSRLAAEYLDNEKAARMVIIPREEPVKGGENDGT
jgi:zinc protease